MAGAAGVTVLVGVIAGVAEQAYALGGVFDDASDRIRVRTGEIGEDLDELNNSFLEVARNAPGSFADASTAIGELHQRLGLVGDDLEARSTQFLQLSHITGEGLSENIRNGARAFREWQVATEAQAEALDQVFRAGQQSGASSAQLFEQIREAGPTFRALGIGWNEALALMTKWEQEGVNSQRVTAALRVGVANLAEAGLPVESTFRAMVTQIREMEDASSATALASQIFGRRAGPELAENIRAGRLSVDELKNSLTGGDSIAAAFDATRDAAENWEQLTKTIQVQGKPTADAVFGIASSITGDLIPALNDATPQVERFSKSLSELLKGRPEGGGDFLSGVLRASALPAGGVVGQLLGLDPVGDMGKVLGQLGQLLDDFGRGSVNQTIDLYGGMALSREQADANRQAAEDAWRQWSASQTQGAQDAVAQAEPEVTDTVVDFYGRVAELFGTSLDEARLRSSLGSSGAALAAALQSAWEKPLDAAARGAVAAAEVALEDEIKKTFGAAKGAEMGAYLQGLTANAAAGGQGSDQSAALTDYLAGLRPRIEAQNEANKAAADAQQKAERDAEQAQRQANQRAKQEAEAAVREAERIAQQHADLLRQYARTAEQLAPEIAAAYGQVGQRAIAALDDAFQEGASGGAGTALARSLTDLAHQARDAGLPAWEDTWRQLVAVGQQAIEDGTPATRAAAEQLIREVNEAIQAANTLTPENFAAALGTAQLATSMGSQGSAIADGLKRGLDEGGKATIETLGRTVESMRVTLLQNPDLSPDRAHELFQQVFARVNDAIADGSQEAIDQIRQFLRDFDFSTGLEAIATKASERGNAAIINAQQGITQAYANRDEAIKRLFTNQAIQEYDRSQQQANDAWIAGYLSDTQKYVEGEKAKIQANRERAQTERQELRETADLEKSYQEQREALLAKRQAADTSSFGTFRAAGAQAQTVSPHQAPGDTIAQQLKDLDTQHTKDLANLKARQDQRRADHAEDVKWAGEDKAALELVNTVLTNAQTAASKINQQFRDTYQLNVIIPRQVNELMTNTDTEVTKINTTLSETLKTYQTETNTAIGRWQYLHDTLVPHLSGGFDSMLDGTLKDAQTWHDLVADAARLAGIAAAGGTSNPDSLPSKPDYHDLPPPPPPVDLPDQSIQSEHARGGDVNVAVTVQGSVTIPDLDTHIVNTINEAGRDGRVRVKS